MIYHKDCPVVKIGLPYPLQCIIRRDKEQAELYECPHCGKLWTIGFGPDDSLPSDVKEDGEQ